MRAVLVILFLLLFSAGSQVARGSDCCCCDSPEIHILSDFGSGKCNCGPLCLEAYVCCADCFSCLKVYVDGELFAESACEWISVEIDFDTFSGDSHDVTVEVEDGTGDKELKCLKMERCQGSGCSGWTYEITECVVMPGGECDVKGEVWLDKDLDGKLDKSVDEPLPGISVMMSNPTNVAGTETTNGDGIYFFRNVACPADYVIAPVSTSYTFSPASEAVTLGALTGMLVHDFLATPILK